MAGFRVHMSSGVVVGIVSAAYFYSVVQFTSIWQVVCVASLGCMGGIAPDLDSDTGRPAKILFIISSSLLVVVTLTHFIARGDDFVTIISFAASAYVVSLVLFWIAKKLTSHRGIMHSIPFVISVSILISILTLSWGQKASMLTGLTFLLGGITHLLLDEVSSMGTKLGFIPYMKRSFGTALKFSGESLWSTFIVYFSLVLLTVVYLSETMESFPF